jgi:hypothetical protein
MQVAFPPTGTTVPGPTAVSIDESECLVFWLSYTDKNPQYPFQKIRNLIAMRLQPINAQKATIVQNLADDPKAYYDFDQSRLSQTLNTDIQSFKARFCGDTYYIYIDSRSYDNPRNDTWDVCRFGPIDGTPPGDTYAYADDSATGVRPYWSNSPASNVLPNPPPPVIRNSCKPVNPTSFQIICAGQDGDFGTVIGTGGDADVKVAVGAPDKVPYVGTNFTAGDKDNITNFSGGKRLGNLIP